MSLISDVKTDVNMREVTFSITAEDLEKATAGKVVEQVFSDKE